MKRYLFIYGEINGGGAERVLLDILQNFDYSNNSVDLLQINSGGLLIDEVPKEANIISAWNGYPISYKEIEEEDNLFTVREYLPR